eukprot:6187841-Pleurochrysis_carterae.AAC.2
MSKEPKEFLSISQLSSKLDSFDYSLEKASVSKEAALRTNLRYSYQHEHRHQHHQYVAIVQIMATRRPCRRLPFGICFENIHM